MKTKVTLQIELNIEHDNNKTPEEVQGFAYWLMDHFLEDTKTDTYCGSGYQVKDFNIEVK